MRSTLALLACSITLAGCSKSPSAINSELRQHMTAIAGIVARTPPTPANVGILRGALRKYREEHATELSRLRADVAKIARREDPRARLVLKAYCALERSLEPGKSAAPAAMLRGNASGALERLNRARAEEMDACIKRLRAE